MNDRIRIIDVETIWDGWSRLTNTTLDYRRRDGSVQRFKREVYDHGNAAAMLLFNPVKETVLLVRQYRYPVEINGDNPDMLEVCAGLLDGEQPEIAAAREALEETGHAPRNIRYICDIYASPGSVTEKVSLFLGEYDETTFRHAGGGLVEEGEEIELVELKLYEALAMIPDGRIMDAKTVVLLQHLSLIRR